MTWLLGFGIPLGYVCGWAVLARSLFRRWHVHEVEKRACPKRKSMSFHEDCVDCRRNRLWWQDSSRRTTGTYADADLAFLAMLQSVVWFVTGPCYLVWRFVTARPPLAPSEIRERDEAQRKADAERIAEQARQIKELERLNRMDVEDRV